MRIPKEEKKKKMMMMMNHHEFKGKRQKKKSLQKFKVTKNLTKMARSSASILNAQQKQDITKHRDGNTKPLSVSLSPWHHEPIRMHHFHKIWGLANQTLEFGDQSESFQEPQDGTPHDTPVIHSTRNETQYAIQDFQESTVALDVPPGNDLAPSLRALTPSPVTTREPSVQAQSVQQQADEYGSLPDSWGCSNSQPSIQESGCQAQSVQQQVDEHGFLPDSWGRSNSQPSIQQSYCQAHSVRERAATLNYPIEHDERGCSSASTGRLRLQNPIHESNGQAAQSVQEQAVRFNVPVEHAEHAHQQDSRRRSQYQLPIQESNGQTQSVHGHVIRINVPTEHDERAHQQEPRGRSLYQLPLQESSGLPQSMQEQATRRNVPVEHDED